MCGDGWWIVLSVWFFCVVQISDLTGGITNLLLKVSPKKSTGLAPVVVRIYGDCTELLIDRAREMKVLAQLNSAGFGAKACAR